MIIVSLIFEKLDIETQNQLHNKTKKTLLFQQKGLFRKKLINLNRYLLGHQHAVNNISYPIA